MKVFSVRKDNQEKVLDTEGGILSSINDLNKYVKKGFLIAATVATIAMSATGMAAEYSTESIMPSTQIEQMMTIDSKVVEFSGENIHLLNLTSTQMEAIYKAGGLNNMDFKVSGDLTKEQVIDAYHDSHLSEAVQSAIKDGLTAESFSSYTVSYSDTFPDGTYSSANIVNYESIGYQDFLSFEGSSEFFKNHEFAHTLHQVDESFTQEVSDIANTYDLNSGFINQEIKDSMVGESYSSSYEVYLKEVYADTFSLVKYASTNPEVQSQKMIDNVVEARVKDRIHFSTGQQKSIYDLEHDTSLALSGLTYESIKPKSGSIDDMHAKTVEVMKTQAEMGQVFGADTFTLKKVARDTMTRFAITNSLYNAHPGTIKNIDSYIGDFAEQNTNVDASTLYEMAYGEMQDFYKSDWLETNYAQRNGSVDMSKIERKADILVTKNSARLDELSVYASSDINISMRR